MESHFGRQLLLVLLLGGTLAGESCAPKLTFGDKEAPAHCTNQAVDGDETDVDCGGPSCPKCENGRHCLDGADCSVGSCVAGVCQAAHCVDGDVTGDESDRDCGGLECLGCEEGQSCRRDSDCISKSCDASTRTCIAGSGGGGGAAGTGGTPADGGNSATGGTSVSGGRGGAGGDATAGGTTGGGASGAGGTGGAGAEGGLPSTGGAPTGGESPGGAASGGAPTGGGSPGGASSGGAPTGGESPGGATSGGAPTGGVTVGGAGAPTGGVPTGGVPTGGVPTGGVPTGGIGTGGLPPGITAIDMLDVANDTIELWDGEGQWYTFHDGSEAGVIAPDTPRDSAQVIPVTLAQPRDESLLAVHVVADDGFETWGAGVGFNLNSPDLDTRYKYDVSSYTGLVFWGRVSTGTVPLRVKLVTAEIAPTTDPGGECTENCNDAYGYPITLTTTWQEFSVPFADLTQEGWGAEPPGGFEPTSVLAVQLHVGSATAFNIWLDDVRFYE